MRLPGKDLFFLAMLALPLGGRAETLLELYYHALETNPALKSREYAVDRAKAQKDQALSKLLPQLVATGHYSLNDFDRRSFGSTQYDGLRGTIQLRQAVFDLASYLRLQGAKSVTLQSKKELEAARMALAGELIDRYLLALEASDDRTYVLAEKSSTASQLNRLRRMHARQLAKVTDLYEVEAYYQTLNTREIEARNAQAVALEQLRETTGVALSGVAPLARESFPPVPRSEEQWVEEATHNNPDLIALQHAIEAARKIVWSGKAEHLPQVALVLSETYADIGFDNLQDPPYDVATASVQLTVPIYEGGRVQATIRDAAARYEIAQQQYEQSRREIERETRTAYLGIVAGRSRIDSTNQEVRAQEKASDAQQKGYDLGVATIVDVLDTRRRLFKARTEQSRARYEYVRNLIALRIRAGSLSDQDMEDLNGWLASDVDTTP